MFNENDDHALDNQDDEENEQIDVEPSDGFMSDVEADADVLRNCGWGTDEDYGYFGENEYDE